MKSTVSKPPLFKFVLVDDSIDPINSIKWIGEGRTFNEAIGRFFDQDWERASHPAMNEILAALNTIVQRDLGSTYVGMGFYLHDLRCKSCFKVSESNHIICTHCKKARW